MPAPYTLHQLYLFTAVVEHASISRAAEALNLTQPKCSECGCSSRSRAAEGAGDRACG